MIRSFVSHRIVAILLFALIAASMLFLMPLVDASGIAASDADAQEVRADEDYLIPPIDVAQASELDSESIARISVSPFYQGNYSDDLGLGNCQNTIASHGCTITSLAMVFNYHQPGFTDPPRLNSCKQNLGFFDGCYAQLDRLWGPCTPDGVSVDGSNIWGSFSWDRIDSDLRNRLPVVVGIDGRPGASEHWVVLVGKNRDGTYITRDPSPGSYYHPEDRLPAWRINAAIHIDGPRGGGGGSQPVPTAKPGQPEPTPNPVPPTPVPIQRCDPPSTNEPTPRSYHSNANVTFRWGSVNCVGSNHGGNYRIQVFKDGGQRIVDRMVNGNSTTIAIPSEFHNQLLYWRVAAEASGRRWSGNIPFYVTPNQQPRFSLIQVNEQTVSSNGQTIVLNTATVTLSGVANDPDGQVSYVELECAGDTCNRRGIRASGTENWSSTFSGLEGRHTIGLYVYDNTTAGGRRGRSDRRTVVVLVDTAPPTTDVTVDGAQNWPDWFQKPVEVVIHADDRPTRSALAGVQNIRYRVIENGSAGPWRTITGSRASFVLNNDARYVVEYYAVDNAGNANGSNQSPRTLTVGIDRQGPELPATAQETNGVTNGQWQRDSQTPLFTWNTATDALSGVAGYQVYFGKNPNGTNHEYLPAARRSWPPREVTVGTATYYLRLRARDNAGNWSGWQTLFVYRYDGTPPANPTGLQHRDGIVSNVWQNTTAELSVVWPAVVDKGSGIRGQYVYWGTDEAGTGTAFVTNNQYTAAEALCDRNAACTGYVRLLSEDNVGNRADESTTSFILRYDGVPPTVDFTINAGASETNQSRVTLALEAADVGSGVRAMRFSYDGVRWTDWEAYQNQRIVPIPSVSGIAWPIYVQVQDEVGLISEAVDHSIVLDVNPDQPQSASFRLFDHTLSAGSAAFNSASFRSRATVGQATDGTPATSNRFMLGSGFEPASQALPLEIPGRDSYMLLNAVFASGSDATAMDSAAYNMTGIVGELGVPNNEVDLASAAFIHRPGFLAWFPRPLPDAEAPPEEDSPSACEEPQIRINADAAYTTTPIVQLDICAPRAVAMAVSNTSDLSAAIWEPYAEQKSWSLGVVDQQVLPRFVYIAFQDADGNILNTYADDIIYDPTAPEVEVLVGDSVAQNEALARSSGVWAQQALLQTITPQATADDGQITLYLNAFDDNSGIEAVQLSATADFSNATWKAYEAEQSWIPVEADGLQQVFVRLRDEAGNISEAVTASYIVDTEGPEGGVTVEPEVIGADASFVTLRLTSADNLGTPSAMRLSTASDMSGSSWQPFVSTVLWPVVIGDRTWETIFVQFRDSNGNESQIYDATYAVDRFAPVIVFSEVAESDSATRSVQIVGYDGLGSSPTTMYLSNDPLMENAEVQPYSEQFDWSFTESGVLWIQLEDAMGNKSDPQGVFTWAVEDDPVDPGRLQQRRLYMPLVMR